MFRWWKVGILGLSVLLLEQMMRQDAP